MYNDYAINSDGKSSVSPTSGSNERYEVLTKQLEVCISDLEKELDRVLVPRSEKSTLDGATSVSEQIRQPRSPQREWAERKSASIESCISKIMSIRDRLDII